MDFLSVILKTVLADSAIKALSRKTGISISKLKKLLPIAIPVLIGMLTKNASSEAGLGSLLEALTQHTSEEPADKQIAEADTEDGAKIVNHILGNEKEQDVKTLSTESEISEDDVSGVLSSIAPMLMSALSASTKSGRKARSSAKKVDLSDGLDLSDVVAMLGGAKVEPAELLGLLGGSGSKKEKDSSRNGSSLLSLLLS